MGSMGLLLSPGTCLLLCFLTQLAAAASGDGGRMGQWGKSLRWGMLGLVSLPWGSPCHLPLGYQQKGTLTATSGCSDTTAFEWVGLSPPKAGPAPHPCCSQPPSLA